MLLEQYFASAGILQANCRGSTRNQKRRHRMKTKKHPAEQAAVVTGIGNLARREESRIARYDGRLKQRGGAAGKEGVE